MLEFSGNPTCTSVHEAANHGAGNFPPTGHGHMAIAAQQTACLEAWLFRTVHICGKAVELRPRVVPWNAVSRNRIPARVQSSLIGRALLHAEITTRFPEADCGRGFIPGGGEHVEFDSCGGLQCLHN
jgi:hypothetical protein